MATKNTNIVFVVEEDHEPPLYAAARSPFTFRSTGRAPALFLTVVATLALAVGLNATVFSVFNAYALRSVSARDADSLYLFTWTNTSGRGHFFSWDEFRQLQRDLSGIFSDSFASRKPLVTRINGHAWPCEWNKPAAVLRLAASRPFVIREGETMTPNHSQFQLPMVSRVRWELGVGSSWELGVGRWELTLPPA